VLSIGGSATWTGGDVCDWTRRRVGGVCEGGRGFSPGQNFSRESHVFNTFPLKKYAENMLIVWKYDLNVTDWFLE